MSRSKRFITGTLAGYGNIVANIVFTLLSVPIALAYLDREQFGMWALAAQINGYLSLIELGMTNAIVRLVADHKDEVNGGKYGSHILTSGLVFIFQGILIGCLGYIISLIGPSIFSIPGYLSSDFSHLLIFISTLSGVSIASRAVASPLWAFHRLDVVNIGFSISTLISLLILWYGLSRGWGVVSYPISQIPSVILTPIIYFWICKRNCYFPSRNHWGRPRLDIFKNIFNYGKNVFLVLAGNQILNASQILIISRFIGLDAAAAYAVGTKIYTMGMMFLANPLSAAGPGLTELYVRGQKERFITRYWDLIKITLASSTVIAVGIASGNSAFVMIWTNNVIEWPFVCSLLLACLVVLKSLSSGYVNLFNFTKKWQPVRYLYLAEAALFLPLAIIFAKSLNITGVIAASLIAHAIITTPLAYRAVTADIGPASKIIKKMIISFGIIGSSAALSWFAVNTINLSEYLTFFLSLLLAAIGLCLCWSFILPDSTKKFFWDKIHTRLRSNINHGS